MMMQLRILAYSGFFRFSLQVKEVAELNSYAPRAAYMRRWTGSTLVQGMACRMSGAKPFPEPMLFYCKLDPWEQTSAKFESKWKTVHYENIIGIVVCLTTAN